MLWGIDFVSLVGFYYHVYDGNYFINFWQIHDNSYHKSVLTRMFYLFILDRLICLFGEHTELKKKIPV